MRYRIWLHPKRGDDYAYEYRSFRAAHKAMRAHRNAEPVIYKAYGRSLLSGYKGSREVAMSQKEMHEKHKRSKAHRKARRSSNPLGLPRGMFRF
jgi:hypothetical protein